MLMLIDLLMPPLRHYAPIRRCRRRDARRHARADALMPP